MTGVGLLLTDEDGHPYPCGNCGKAATHALRSNGHRSLSIWMLVLIPTGVRIDAYLCRPCLVQLANVRNPEGQDIHYAFSVPHADPHASGKSGAMQQIKRILGMEA